MTPPDYTFITDRLAIGNVTARSVPGWVAIVTLLATDRPGILWDELCPQGAVNFYQSGL